MRRMALLSGLLGLLACGGKAVVDGTASSGGSGGSSTTTTSSTTSTTGPGGSGSCADACAAMSTTPWCAVDATCALACEAARSDSAACSGAADQALGCLAAQAEATNCWMAQACGTSIGAWASCLGYPGSCGGQSGTGDNYNCESNMTCGSSLFAARCHYSDMQVDCVCSIDGFTLGLCAGSGDSPCDLQQGCCTAYF